MSKKRENDGFICAHCGTQVLALTNGSYRNHCPLCLYSIHIDEDPGDRRHTCQGLMKPIGLKYNSQKGYQVIHRCNKCGETKVNRVAENTVQPDSVNELVRLNFF